ncbi:unnamed protein product, partial [Rotaria sp. Silwood1]
DNWDNDDSIDYRWKAAEDDNDNDDQHEIQHIEEDDGDEYQYGNRRSSNSSSE